MKRKKTRKLMYNHVLNEQDCKQNNEKGQDFNV